MENYHETWAIILHGYATAVSIINKVSKTH